MHCNLSGSAVPAWFYLRDVPERARCRCGTDAPVEPSPLGIIFSPHDRPPRMQLVLKCGAVRDVMDQPDVREHYRGHPPTWALCCDRTHEHYGRAVAVVDIREL